MNDTAFVGTLYWYAQRACADNKLIELCCIARLQRLWQRRQAARSQHGYRVLLPARARIDYAMIFFLSRNVATLILLARAHNFYTVSCVVATASIENIRTVRCVDCGSWIVLNCVRGCGWFGIRIIIFHLYCKMFHVLCV